MNQQQATHFILRLLDQGHTCEQIAEEICAQTGWPARQVELFVRKVAAETMPEQDQTEVAPVATPAAPPPVQIGSPPPPRKRKLDPDDEQVRFVIKRLGRQHTRNDVVQALCEQQGWSWPDADRFVRQVQIQYHDKIAARQSPIVILLGVGILLGGIALSAYIVLLTISGEYINLSGVPVPFLENMVYLTTGIGMIIGGIAGIWRAVSQMRS